MKKILWIFVDKTLILTVNWFEYLILKNIFKKRKYHELKSGMAIRGQEINLILFDGVIDVNV